ncbi:hypothetical protein NM688_g1070 [Phlebia brevispora]|uniref:Uncharacterized protein n=1 Tax=Phlebia brevispora TaxID=194682 RepID=A0ACC1TCK1_9APHY|nr:hypothetical protein NM688_g1070 [Phlebia brevispora]
MPSAINKFFRNSYRFTVGIKRSSKPRRRKDATASDVPIELYDLIISFYEPPSLSELSQQDSRNQVTVSKREMGQIALVCCSWARTCQPKIFRDVALRSNEDADTLLRLANSPTSRIANYLSPYTSLCRPLRQLLPSSPEFRMSVSGVSHLQLMTAMHTTFPRSIASRLLRVPSIRLQSVQFERFHDLAKLLAEMPSLGKVSCRNVTWKQSFGDDVPPPVPGPRRVALPVKQYSMRGCTSNTGTIWLSTLLIQSDPLHMEDARALCSIASGFSQYAGGAIPAFSDLSTSARSTKDAICFCARDLAGLSWTPAIKFSLYSSNRTRRVRRIDIDYRCCSQLWHPDWMVIDDHMAALSDLESVVFSFRARQDMMFVANEVARKGILHLSTSTRLWYTIPSEEGSVGKGSKWYKGESIHRGACPMFRPALPAFTRSPLRDTRTGPEKT